MSEEYEEEYYEEEETTDLPAGVLERIAKHAERLKKPMDEIRTAYLNYIRSVHGCDDWQSEDADLLEDWAEQMVVELRNTGGGGSMAGSVSFVGCFVGYSLDFMSDRRVEFIESRVASCFKNVPSAKFSKLFDTEDNQYVDVLLVLF